VPLKPYAAALIAHGDVPFSLDHWPHEVAFGLAAHGGRVADGSGWRRALAGQLIEPIERRRQPGSPLSVRHA